MMTIKTKQELKEIMIEEYLSQFDQEARFDTSYQVRGVFSTEAQRELKGRIKEYFVDVKVSFKCTTQDIFIIVLEALKDLENERKNPMTADTNYSKALSDRY